MTGSAPTPQAMTLEEAVARVRKAGYELEFDSADTTPWAVFQPLQPDGSGPYRWWGQTWPEAVSQALGVPVVERDPAAELAEAVSRYLGAHDDLRAWDEDDEGSYDHYKAQVRGDTTLDALRAALAAYEASRK